MSDCAPWVCHTRPHATCLRESLATGRRSREQALGAVSAHCHSVGGHHHPEALPRPGTARWRGRPPLPRSPSRLTRRIWSQGPPQGLAESQPAKAEWPVRLTLRPGRKQRSPQDGRKAAGGRASHRPPGPGSQAGDLEPPSSAPPPRAARPWPAGLRTRRGASLGPPG